jgi:hypothetical protein
MPIEIYPVAFYAALVAVPFVDWRRPAAVAGVAT